MPTWLVVNGAVAGLATGSAHAGPILEFSSGTTYQVGQDFSFVVGWEFTTSAAFTVTALDAYLVAPGGGQVRLHDSTGTTLASATILSTEWAYLWPRLS